MGGLAAADGATYTAPADIPYKFGMVAQVSGYHKVLSVTSTSDKLKVSTADDQSTMVGSVLLGKVIKKANIRNRYNQASHLTHDTTWESDINTIKHHIQESQEVSPFPAGDHKATVN